MLQQLSLSICRVGQNCKGKCTYIYINTLCMRILRCICVYLMRTQQTIPCTHRISRVGQNCIYTPYMTVYVVIPLPKIPYIHRIYMVLANPTYKHQCRTTRLFASGDFLLIPCRLYLHDQKSQFCPYNLIFILAHYP